MENASVVFTLTLDVPNKKIVVDLLDGDSDADDEFLLPGA